MWVHGADMVWRYFDIGASFIWAVSGALLAARRGYDLTGICAVALISSTGGGLLRDGLFLQQGPPAMLLSPLYIAAAALAGSIVWGLGLKARVLTRVTRSVGVVVDAIGLGGFAVVGMQLAERAGISTPGVVLVGVVNAVGGSVLRSLLLRETPEVFRPGELTALASFVGCLIHVGLTLGLGADPKWAAAITIAAVALLRGGSVRFGLRTYPARGFVPPAEEQPTPVRPRELAASGRGG